MTDPLGLIGAGGINQPSYTRPNPVAKTDPNAPDFAAMLRRNLGEVNGLQQDATRAVEDLMSGQRDDVEGVILATEKAETAFKMLQAMRNKVMGAYEEIKQIRV